MLNLFVGLDIYTGLLLLLALAFVLFYEAINGFHDTANAVATVIYTRAMQPQLAVVMAAFFNFFGVLLGGLSVAYAIVHMLPTDLLLNMGSTHGLAMVFSMLLAAIIWNLGTWFFGLPASSSHTLIGAIIGIGLTNALLTGSSVMDALNLREVTKIFSSLIVSPIVGLVIAGGLIFLLRRYWSGTKKRDRIHRIPEDRKKKKGKRKPPFWTRIALIVSAAGVAFSHGANDGQKGIGLVMLVLVGIAPAGFVVNMNASTDGTQVTEFHCHPANTFDAIARVKTMLPGNMESYEPLSVSQRSQLRRIMLCISDTSAKLAKLPGVSKEDQNLLKKLRSDMLSTIEYAPVWIIMAVALALGIGTMIGWRRVAMTIGEKIGKRGMTYAQGMAAQMTAAVSIGLASYIGMP
ncbi:MAG: inorganic phosphate transporter, partial [Escherichia coli]|nr:inorganic phosphate transporter [Escherichia coli]